MVVGEEEFFSFGTEFGKEVYSVDASLRSCPKMLGGVVFRVTADPVQSGSYL